jgi:hypothetical protein
MNNVTGQVIMLICQPSATLTSHIYHIMPASGIGDGGEERGGSWEKDYMCLHLKKRIAGDGAGLGLDVV